VAKQAIKEMCWLQDLEGISQVEEREDENNVKTIKDDEKIEETSKSKKEK
jgi:hypothetical protein